jgi:hypothetical protein
LSILLKRAGYSFGKELSKVLKSDISNPRNKQLLDILVAMIPYIAVNLSDADLAILDQVYGKSDALVPADGKTKMERAEELNNILKLEMQKKDASTTP